MKTSLKILILFLFVILAGGCIYIYMRIVMAPPMEMKTDNQFQNRLAELTEEFRNSREADPENNFRKFNDLTDRFYKEKFLSPEEGQESYCDYILVYAPKFTYWTFNQFRQPEWDESQLSWIESRADYLKNIKNPDGYPLIVENSPATRGELDVITETISNYRSAKDLSKATFKNIRVSEDLIKKSEKLKEDPYLMNNTFIRNALADLPVKLERGHYNMLKGKVAGLQNYRIHDRESYEYIVKNVRNMIDEYRYNARKVYGVDGNLTARPLNELLGAYYSEATDYYDKIEAEKELELRKLQNESSYE